MSPATIKQALALNAGPVYWFDPRFNANYSSPPTMSNEWSISLRCPWHPYNYLFRQSKLFSEVFHLQILLTNLPIIWAYFDGKNLDCCPIFYKYSVCNKTQPDYSLSSLGKTFCLGWPAIRPLENLFVFMNLLTFLKATTFVSKYRVKPAYLCDGT